jgi:Cu/Ag efflux pump CusA
MSLIVAVSFLAVTLFSGKFLGTEFLPQLNEGSLDYRRNADEFIIKRIFKNSRSS